MEIEQELCVTLFGVLLFFVQLPPEAIYRSHVQHFVRIDLPGIATKSGGEVRTYDAK